MEDHCPGLSWPALMRRCFLILSTLVSVSAAAWSADGDTGRASFRFVVVGDRTGNHVEGVYGEILDEVQRLRPDFVITVGDMIEG